MPGAFGLKWDPMNAQANIIQRSFRLFTNFVSHLWTVFRYQYEKSMLTLRKKRNKRNNQWHPSPELKPLFTMKLVSWCLAGALWTSMSTKHSYTRLHSDSTQTKNWTWITPTLRVGVSIFYIVLWSPLPLRLAMFSAFLAVDSRRSTRFRSI